MLVTFPTKIAQPTGKEISFLKELDARLCNKSTGFPNYSYKIRLEELSYLLSLFNFDNGLVLNPFTHSYGYGYHVAHTTPKPNLSDAKGKYEVLLGFDYTQLPDDISFRRMAEVFMRPENIDKIVGTGGEAPVNDLSKYSY